jgi:hypothetical protein
MEEQAADEAPSPVSSLQARDSFTDSQGQRWLVHSSRNGVVLAHPVVDGKAQVNKDSGVPFAISEQGRIRNPDYRTDIQSVEKWTEEADSKPVAQQSVAPTISREQVENHFVKKQTDLGASEQTARQTAKKTYGRIWEKIRKSPWKTMNSLQVKGRGGVSLGRMVRDKVTEMKKAGFLTVAWDRDGNPHYALPGTQTPEWLTETDTDEARSKLPVKPTEQSAPSPADVSEAPAKKKKKPAVKAKQETKESPAKTYLRSLNKEDLQDLARELDVKATEREDIVDEISDKLNSQPTIREFLETAAAKAKPPRKKKRQAAPRGESDKDASLPKKPEGKEIPSKDFTEDERKQEQILKKIGITLRLVEGSPDQGVPGLFIPNSRTIWLVRNYVEKWDSLLKKEGRPEKAMTWGLFAHEMFHAIKRSSPKAWRSLYNWVSKNDSVGLGKAKVAYLADMKEVDAGYYERLLEDEDLLNDEGLSRYLEDRAAYFKFWNDLGKAKPGLLARIGRWVRRVLRFAEPGVTNPNTLAGQTRQAIERAMKRNNVAMKGKGGRRAAPARGKEEFSEKAFTPGVIEKVFGVPKDVATAVSSIAEAMGLDKSRIQLVKGGMPAENALFQVHKILSGEEPVAVQKTLKSAVAWIGEYANQNKVVPEGVDFNTSDGRQAAVDAIVKHTLLEINAWKKLNRSYISFYTTDIIDRANPWLSKWAKRDKDIAAKMAAEGRDKLTDDEVKLLHIMGSFSSANAIPSVDTLIGLMVLKEWMLHGTLTGMTSNPKHVWKTDYNAPRDMNGQRPRKPTYVTPRGKITFESSRVTSSGKKIPNEPNLVPGKFKKISRTFNLASARSFSKLVDHFGGGKSGLAKAIKWMESEHTWAEIVSVIGDKAAKKLKVHEYLKRDLKNPNDPNLKIVGAFALGDNPKQGSYILNRWQKLKTITKDMWVARTMSRYFREPNTGVPWKHTNQLGRIKRQILEDAWVQVAETLGVEPAIVQEMMWDMEKLFYGMMGVSTDTSYPSDGVLRSLTASVKASVELTDSGIALMRAFNKPTVADGIHELGHVARMFLFDKSIPKDMREGITDADIDVAMKWSGVVDGNWTTEAEEKFANGLLKYIKGGKFTSKTLRSVFEKVVSWLRKIYKSIDNKTSSDPVVNLEISPAMQEVYGKLVSRGIKDSQLSWEAIPSKTLDIIPEIHNASYAVKKEYLKRITDVLFKNGDWIAKAVGLDVPVTITGFSAWQGDIGAGSQSKFEVMLENNGGVKTITEEYRKKLDLYANILGYVLSQDGVYWHLPVYSGDPALANGFEITGNRAWKGSEFKDLYDAMLREFGKDTDLAPAFMPNGARILNFSIENLDFRSRMEKVVSALHGSNPSFLGGTTTTKSFRSEGNEYNATSNNWQSNPNGEEYTSRIGGTGRPDLQRRSDNVRQAVISATRKFAKEQGWNTEFTATPITDSGRRYSPGRRASGGRSDPDGRISDRGALGENSRSRGGKSDGGNGLDQAQEKFNKEHGLDSSTLSLVAVYENPAGPVLELNPRYTAEIYHKTLDKLRSSHPAGIQVSLKDVDEYRGFRLFMAEDGTAVAALNGQDMVSLASGKNASGSSMGSDILYTLIEQGGRTGDAYGSFLPKLYARFGFQPVARIGWSDEIWAEYAGAEVGAGRFAADAVDPANLFKAYGGKVDYYFVAYTGDTTPFDTLDKALVEKVPLVDDWDAGLEAQQRALRDVAQKKAKENRNESEKVSKRSGTRFGAGRRTEVEGRRGETGYDTQYKTPLADAPRKQGATGPDPKVVQAAERYAKSVGIELKRQAKYVAVDEKFAKRIAKAYEEMANDPFDPKVVEAYRELYVQTTAQYQALVDEGFSFYFYDGKNDPYADKEGGFSNPYNAIRELRTKQRMAVFPTSLGFGDKLKGDDYDVKKTPSLASTGIMWPWGSPDGPLRPVLANDLFRAVHDTFGHSMEGAGFRARGEENAWQAHVRLFYGAAVGAMTSSTRGQNSWLNFGPYGETNQTAKVEDTVFADQKIGLMPEWTWTEGRAADMEETGDEGVRYSPSRQAKRKRDPEITKAAQDLKAGLIDRNQYQRIVDMRMPLRKFDEVPIPASKEDMLRGLGDRKAGDRLKRDLIQNPEDIAKGRLLETRLDIPAYDDENVWVVSLHEPRPDLNKGSAGRVVAYTPTSVLRNVTFGVTENAALNIAAGKPKSTIATMRGEYVPMTAQQAYKLAETNKDRWVEIGMNPIRHTYFYDKDTQTPVVSAEEVVQVGGMVLAKNPVLGRREDYRYSPGRNNDAKYLAAVDQGDMAKAQRMVDAAAAGAGEVAGGVSPVLYHGSPHSNFYEFQIPSKGFNSTVFGSYEVSRNAAFFTTDEEAASRYREQGGRKGGSVRKFRVFGELLDWRNGITDAQFNTLVSKGVNSRWLDRKGASWELFDKEEDPDGTLVKAIQKMGYDGVIIKDTDGTSDFDAYVAFTPSQIKSSDAVTYDDSGNVVPLSKRFDETLPDVRYSPRRKPKDDILAGLYKRLEEEGLIKPQVREPSPPASDETTGTKNVKTNELRALAGLGERVMPERESVDQWQAEAARRIAKTPGYPARLAEELANNPRAIDRVEEAVLGRYIRDLENRRQAGESVLDEILTATEASEKAGSIWGQTGVSRQVELASDFSVAGLVRRHLREVQQRPTESQLQEYAQLADRIKKLEAQNAKLVEELAKETIARKKAEAAAQPEPEKPKLGTKRATVVKKVADAFSVFQNLWSGGNRPAAGRNLRPQTDTPEFKKWFGDSKVVDADGKPLVVYHGTNAEFDAFEDTPMHGMIWFAIDKELAAQYGEKVLPVYLKVNEWDKDGGKWQVRGRDVIWVRDKSQIKSATGNRGTFDPSNPDIRYSPSRQPNDIKAAANNVVSALREAGVSSILEVEAQIKANLRNASPEQIQAIRDAWNESISKNKPESPIGDNPTDPELGARAKELMRAAVELGYGAEEENWMDVVDVVYEQLSTEVPGISKYETMQAMSDYGVWQSLNKEPVEVIIRAIRGKARQSLKIEDTINAIKQSEEWLNKGVSPEEVARRLREKGLLPKATGQERATPDSIERELISQFNKLKKTLPVPAESKEGQLKSALTTAKTAAKNRLEMLDKDIAALDEAVKSRTKLVKPVDEKTPLEPDEDLLDLRSQLEQKRRVRDKLKADYEKIFPPTKPKKGRKPLTEEQRLDASVRMLERQISAVKADVKALEDGTWAPAAKNPELTSERKEELVAELRTLRQLRKVALEANPVYQATEELKYWQRYRKAQERRLAFWQRRLEEAKAGRIPVPLKKRTITEKAILEKNMEIEEVQYDAMIAIEKAKRATWNTGQWIGQGILEATSLIPKTLMLGLEMSFVLRQGFFYTYSQPMKAFYALMEAIPAVFSQRLALESADGLKSRPNAKEYELAKVDFTQVTGPQAKLEELYQSAIIRWLENTETKLLLPLRTWAKLYAMAERGNRTFSNIMKADMYDIQKRDTLAAREFFKVNTGWTEDDIKETGRIANIFSGRGTGLKGGNPWLDWLFLARRWTWSRIQADFIVPFQLVTPQWIGQWNADRGMRVALAKLYIQAMVGHTAKMAVAYVAYRLLAGDDEEEMPTFEFDLRSSDALAMKIGETRFKDEGGLMPAIVLASRILTGKMKTSEGEIKSIYGDDVQYGGKTAADFIINYGRYKLGTAPSAILEWASGRDAVGNVIADKDDPTAIYRNIVGSRITPLTYREIYAAESELGLKRGTLAALEAFFGVSVSTHGSRSKYKKASEEDRKKQFEKDLEAMDYNTPDFGYKDLLTDKQRKQMFDQREAKKQAVVYAALANPQRKTHKSDESFQKSVSERDKAIEKFRTMGLDFNDARLMLLDYYKRQYGSAYEMRGNNYVLRESYVQRLRQLRKVLERK